MASLSVRRVDDDVYERLKARAAEHGVSMEEEVRQILAKAVAPQVRLGDLFQELFGEEHGFELEPLPREPHEPLDFSE